MCIHNVFMYMYIIIIVFDQFVHTRNKIITCIMNALKVLTLAACMDTAQKTIPSIPCYHCTVYTVH